MGMSPTNQEAPIMTKSTLTPAEQALHTFIIKKYPKRGLLFSTSWTSCSLASSEEEALICAWLDEKKTNSLSGHDHDWFKEIPSLLFDLAVKAGVNKDDDDYAGVELYSMFAGDFMRDSMFCHLRDY